VNLPSSAVNSQPRNKLNRSASQLTKPSNLNLPSSAVNTYGSTKLLFEEEIRKRWPQHVILRSSLIYGTATKENKKNKNKKIKK
jgi:dTDP-4-dehydrorhamnose reductase